MKACSIPVIEATIRTRALAPANAICDDRSELIGFRTFATTPPEVVDDYREDIFGTDVDRIAHLVERYDLHLLNARRLEERRNGRWAQTFVLTYGLPADLPAWTPPPGYATVRHNWTVEDYDNEIADLMRTIRSLDASDPRLTGLWDWAARLTDDRRSRAEPRTLPTAADIGEARYHGYRLNQFGIRTD